MKQHQEEKEFATSPSSNAPPSFLVCQTLHPLRDVGSLLHPRLNALRGGRQTRPRGQAHISLAAKSWRRDHILPELANVRAEPILPLTAGDKDREGLEQPLKFSVCPHHHIPFLPFQGMVVLSNVSRHRLSRSGILLRMWLAHRRRRAGPSHANGSVISMLPS